MTLSRRAFTASGLSIVALAVVVAACSDRGGPLLPRPDDPGVKPPTEGVLAALECSGSTATRTVSCASVTPQRSGIAANELTLGGQAEFVHLRSDNIVVAQDTFGFDVTVQNLIRQTIGTTDGTMPDTAGVRVFFHSGPTVTGGGGGSIGVANPDGTGNFTGSNQPFFRYSEILADSAISAPKRWKLDFSHPSGGDVSFTFSLYVVAAVPFPNGWVEIDPDGGVLDVSETLQLTATVYNRTGRVATGDPVTWSSDSTAIASVDSNGLVTANAEGTTSIRATSNAGRTGAVEVIVSSPITARDTTYDAIGNVTLQIGAGNGLLNAVQGGAGVSIVVDTATTAEGGTVIFAADGGFEYLSAAGFVGPDSVQYTATNGVHNSTAWLKLPSERRFWYVEAGAEASGADGTDARPFPALGGAAAVWAAGDTTLVRHGGGSTIEGGVALLAGQGLIGEGIGDSIRAVLNGDTIVLLAGGGMAPALGRSTAGATLTLGENNVLRGLAIGSSDGAAIAGTDFGTLTTGEMYVSATGPALSLTNGTLAGTFAQFASTNSAGRGLSLVNVDGTLAPAAGAINGAAGAAIYVEGGTVVVSFPGDITNEAGRSVHVTGRSGGAVTLSGDLDDTGTGILIHDNTAGTVAFTGEVKSLSTGAEPAVTLADNAGAAISFTSGGLAITTTSGIGFSSTGGGTLTVTGDHNTVSTGTGVAVSLVNTTIGAGGVTFRSVSGSGAGGIVLHTTGANPFVVTGDGATAGSGGTIAATTAGVSLTNTGSVTLDRMVINGAGSGIVGNAFGTLNVTGTAVSSSAAAALDLFGGAVTGTFSSVSSSGSATVGVALNDVAGTWSVQGGSVVGSANGAAMLLAGNSGGGTLTWSAALSQANAHPVLNVSSHTSGTLNLIGALSSTGTSSGLRFAGANGTYNITPSSATTLTGTGGAISFLTGSAGAFTFSGNVHASYSAGATVPFVVNGASPTVTFNGDLTKGGSATGTLVSITDHGIGGGITFQNGTLSATAGDGILLSNADGAVSFNGTTTLSGGAPRVRITNGSSGAIAFGTSASITDPTAGPGLHITNANAAANVTFAGPISSNAHRPVHVEGVNSGTVTVSGNLTATGQGLLVQSNSGGTIAFTGATKSFSTGANAAVTLTSNGSATVTFNGGGLAITTTSGAGFSATGGGTVQVTGTANTVTTGTGTAVNLNAVGTGASGVTFREVHANGAPNGITIQNTTGGSGFQVTGSGGSCTIASPTCTGGHIQNTTGTGVNLAAAGTVSLTRVRVRASGQQGVHASGSTNLTLTSAYLQQNGTGDGHNGLNVLNASGSVLIDNSSFNGAYRHLVNVDNTNANLTFTVQNGSVFEFPNPVPNPQGTAFPATSAILITPKGSSAVTASVTNTTFRNIPVYSFQIGPTLSSTATSSATFSNNTVSVDAGLNVTCASNPQCRVGNLGIGGTGGTLHAVVTNNTFTRVNGDGVFIIGANQSSTLRGRFEGNVITDAMDDAIVVGRGQNANMRLLFNNNTISNLGGDAFEVAAGEDNATNTGRLDLVITNNNISNVATNPSLAGWGGVGVFRFGHSAQELCLAMTGNTVTGSNFGIDFYGDGNFTGHGGTMVYEMPGTGTVTEGDIHTRNPGMTLANIFSFSMTRSNGVECHRPGI